MHLCATSLRMAGASIVFTKFIIEDNFVFVCGGDFFFGGLVAHRLLRSHELKSPLNISFMCEIRLIECFRSSRLCLKTIRFVLVQFFDLIVFYILLVFKNDLRRHHQQLHVQRGGVRRHLLGRLQLSPYIWF